MSSKKRPFALWVGREEDRTIVALRPMTLSGSKSGQSDEKGALSRTVVPEGTTVKSGGGFTAFLTLLAVAGALASCIAGTPWAVRIGLVVLAFILFACSANLASGEVTVARLQPDEHLIFDHPDDRQQVDRLTDFAKRIDHKAPALQQVIPQAEARETLARALWQGTGLLARQRDVRAVIDDLDEQDTNGLPSDSVAVRELAAQRERALLALDGLKAELEELESVFAAVVEASDEFAREQEIREATRRAEDVLAGFAAPGRVSPEDESDRLANHTLAVVEGTAA